MIDKQDTKIGIQAPVNTEQQINKINEQDRSARIKIASDQPKQRKELRSILAQSTNENGSK